jgi:hypothetical protein
LDFRQAPCKNVCSLHGIAADVMWSLFGITVRQGYQYFTYTMEDDSFYQILIVSSPMCRSQRLIFICVWARPVQCGAFIQLASVSAGFWHAFLACWTHWTEHSAWTLYTVTPFSCWDMQVLIGMLNGEMLVLTMVTFNSPVYSGI